MLAHALLRSSVRPRRYAQCLGLAVLLCSVGCNRGAPPGQGNKAPEVVATTPITSMVTDYQDFTGRLEAVQTVDIKARVSGYLTSAKFTEGASVKEHDILFEIDSRIAKKQLEQTEDVLQRDTASLRDAEETRRQNKVAGQVAVTAQELQQADTLVRTLTASVRADEAARDQAKTTLDYCTVYAPFSGKISYRYVHPGNSVTADVTVLTTLVTENPIYAYFDVDERTYLDFMSAASKWRNSWFSSLHFPVLMRLSNENEYTRMGKVDFIDNRIIATSGTVRMRGVFDNSVGILKPGLFVRIRLPIGTPYAALLIPDEALQSDQGRRYIYTINEKEEVVYRPVTLGQAIHGLRVIKEGLKAGERIIVSGVQRVRQGVAVTVKMQDPPKPPDSPLTRALTAHFAEPLPGKGMPAD